MLSTMQRVQEHLDEALTHFHKDQIVGIFLQGSQNYGLDTPLSDVDTKLIVVAEARTMADKAKAHVEEMAEYAYSIYPNKEDPEVNALLDDAQYEIMKTAVERELSEDD